MPVRKTVAGSWEQMLSNKRLATASPQLFTASHYFHVGVLRE